MFWRLVDFAIISCGLALAAAMVYVSTGDWTSAEAAAASADAANVAASVSSAAEVAEMLSAELPDVEAALDSRSRVKAKVDELVWSNRELMREVRRISGLEAYVGNRVKRVEDLVRSVNAKQLEQLVDRLREVERLEVARREAAARNPQLNRPLITKQALEGVFVKDDILDESDHVIERWVRDVLGKESEKIQEPLRQAIARKKEQTLEVTKVREEEEKDVVPSKKRKKEEEDAAVEKCVTPERAAQEVQEAVVKFSMDTIGMYDHVSYQNAGMGGMSGSIVHEMTSDTYNPPNEDPENNPQSLRNVWWSRYVIPEDWENSRILPEGWQDWDASIPPFLAHTLGMYGVGSALRASSVAPPEAVLDSNTLPGACWPMDGRQGVVTIRLPYPVAITDVSIDHAPLSLMPDAERQKTSAPRAIKVYGYLPCEDRECRGVGFDPKGRTVLTKFEYDIDEGGVQTFQVRRSGGGSSVDGSQPQLDGDGGGDEVAAAGSCSAETLTCDGDGEKEDNEEKDEGPYSAIGVEIKSNWGNEDYTCIYRIRVHGDAAAAAAAV